MPKNFMNLAPYASRADQSRGRLHAEPVGAHTSEQRSEFQRDRDRIVHSTAFRRLVYKTQVFLNHEGDLFRTRLTHSLEVAQLGRSIARALQLNEDLVEAIALAHDLGHTPFGHAGQDALHECLRAHYAEPENATPAAVPPDHDNGFEHNLQSLRVVDELEERYPTYNGLNLTLETREGILKHCSAANARRIESREPHHTQPTLEAQLANIADEIAYNAHDIDDGVRSGLITLEQLADVPLFARLHGDVMREHPSLQGRRVLFETIRRMLSAQVYDVIDSTRAALQSHSICSLADVRQAPPLVQFSGEMRAHAQTVKRWLFQNLYRHPQVTHNTDQAKHTVRVLFAAYLHNPQHMPVAFAQRTDAPRAVADYIAGMTDRFAIKEHERLAQLNSV
jgi:dGTPase